MPTLPSSGKEVDKKAADPNIFTSTLSANVVRLKHEFDALPPTTLTGAYFCIGGVTTLLAVRSYNRYGRRIVNAQWVTPKIIRQQRWLKGVATSVGDGDNFRFYHTPTIGFTWPLRWKRIPTSAKELKDETIHIRIAGVDAPEASHFGKPAQPYAENALLWLRSQILGKVVYCQLLRQDQYGRMVAEVQFAPRLLPGWLFNGKNLATEMLNAGWAVTYEQAGAHYGVIGKEGYLQLEQAARRGKKGMWKKGGSLESPSEYKRRVASDTATLSKAEPIVSNEKITPSRRKSPESWWKRLLS